MKKRAIGFLIVNENFLVKALNVVAGKWKILIIFVIAYSKGGKVRYGDLRYLFRNDIAPRVLTQQLRELEACGLINREVFPTSPVKVEYSLTELGKQFIPVIDEMYKFGRIYCSAMSGKNGTALECEEDNV